MTPAAAEYNTRLLHACAGREDAFTFLVLFNRFCHEIDDVIDEGRAGKPMDAERVVSAFVLAAHVYSHPFYLQHAARLHPVVLLVANAYADSVAWEKSAIDGQRTMADVLRCAGNEMVFAVAAICGGWDHLRKVSAAIREDSWATHHTPTGQPV